MPTDVEDKVEELMEGQAKNERPETSSLLEEAKQVRDELKELSEDLQKQRAEIKEFTANTILGGKSILGQPEEKTKEQLAQEEAAKILETYGK